MPRITSRQILDRFIELYTQGRPFTPSENRMNGIKLAKLRKTIKEHLSTTGRETNLSVEQIILDAMEYGAIIGMRFRSISSLGYDILDKSIDYWEKRRKLEEVRKEEALQNNNQNDATNSQADRENSYKPPKRTAPWLNTEDW